MLLSWGNPINERSRSFPSSSTRTLQTVLYQRNRLTNYASEASLSFVGYSRKTRP